MKNLIGDENIQPNSAVLVDKLISIEKLGEISKSENLNYANDNFAKSFDQIHKIFNASNFKFVQ